MCIRDRCMPDSLKGRRYYHPTDQGSEAKVRQRMAQIDAWKKAHPPQ